MLVEALDLCHDVVRSFKIHDIVIFTFLGENEVNEFIKVRKVELLLFLADLRCHVRCLKPIRIQASPSLLYDFVTLCRISADGKDVDPPCQNILVW